MPAALDRGASDAREWRGKLELLVVQPTPFCNLDCDYCYLPARDQTHRMDLGTLAVATAKVFDARLPAPRLSVVWHAGEPMMVPREWYREAFSIVGAHRSPAVEVTHHFQTNGVVIDRKWCEFFLKHDVRVGVSLDGPARLHDTHRKNRAGRGTHDLAMRGVERLREAGIPFHAICVLTWDSLSQADEIFEFFANLGPSYLCFNIEEVEAENRRSSLADMDRAVVDDAFHSFVARIVERLRSTPTAFRIREIDNVLGTLRHPTYGTLHGNSQNLPGRILSVGWDGRFATFSPELLGGRHPTLGSLDLGNVLTDDLAEALAATFHDARYQEIARGVERCRDTCKYFDLCLGGAPSNKLGERGRFDVADTMFCRLTQQIVVDVVLSALELDLSTSSCTGLASR